MTLNGAEDIPVAAGDIVYVGPGVYREMLTCDVSGGNTYSAGTVTVTNGSTTVTGAGTAFLANVAIADMFHVRYFATGNDGVTNGTATFTSAAGNFQANMIGKVIQINTRGAYAIGAVAAANSITLTDPNGLGWPAAAVGLTYSVMSGEGPYEIASVTDNTNFELVRSWCGPTLTGLAYLTYRPIRYIGDVSGENTDGVGGVCRITGSDNDQTSTRGDCIRNRGGRDYRLFRGFQIDIGSDGVMIIGGDYFTLEDSTLYAHDHALFEAWDCICSTVRRCIGTYSNSGIHFRSNAPYDDAGHLVENCVLTGGLFAIATIYFRYVGGATVKNCVILGAQAAIRHDGWPTIGQTVVVNNCIFDEGRWCFLCAAVGQVTEDYNSLYIFATARQNTTAGANSITSTSLLAWPILLDRFKFPWWFGELSEWSQVRAIAGTFEACGDLRGSVRPITSAKKSWGALQFADMERETGTVRTGSVSMVLHDAGRHHIWVPVTSVPTIVSVWVRRETNYAGNLPQMIIKQPGQPNDVTTDTAAVNWWNELTTTLIPAADPPYVVVELVSRNTAVAGNFEVFFDDLDVS